MEETRGSRTFQCIILKYHLKITSITQMECTQITSKTQRACTHCMQEPWLSKVPAHESTWETSR